MTHSSTQKKPGPRILEVAGLVLALMLTIAVPARAVIVANGNFEADSVTDIPEGASATATSWTIGPGGPFASAALYDPTGSIRFPADPAYAGENNAAVVYTNGGFFRQLLGITLASNTRYRLTVDVGNDAIGGGFPTVINGVSGDARARLLVNGATSPMPGLVSSTAATPPVGNFNTWTLVWETGWNEPLLGSDLTFDLSRGATGGNTWFDNVTLTAELIPEPSTVLLLGLGGLFAWRKTRRLTQR